MALRSGLSIKFIHELDSFFLVNRKLTRNFGDF